MVSLYEQAWQEPTFGTIHAPPQHGKTETTATFIIACLLRDPTLRIVYATYEAKRAWRVSVRVRQKAIQAGVQLSKDAASKDAWQTTSGGQVIFTGVGGPLTGEPADIILIDDPYKNRQQALSAAWNQMVQDWFQDVVESRTHKGSSIFIHHTRWHADDLIGWVQKNEAHAHYEHVILPAIDEDGNALWPLRHSIKELLRRQRANPDQFAGLYQGIPPIDAGQIFPLPVWCEPDSWGRQGRVGLGMDAAYTEKKQGDSCAIVVLREVPEYDVHTRTQLEPYYVVEYAAKQRAPLEDFTFTLRSVQSRFPGARVRWSGSSIEGEIARRLELDGVRVDFHPAINDKLVRSEAVAQAWRLGQIRIPEGAEWADDFVAEVTSFTGVEGRPDDYVDALADAFAAVSQGSWLSGWASAQ